MREPDATSICTIMTGRNLLEIALLIIEVAKQVTLINGSADNISIGNGTSQGPYDELSKMIQETLR